jgi:hypothetical protein
MYGKQINMDSIKGSSVFAQESDFAVAVNRTLSGFRYVKDIFYRYAPDDSDTVMEFEISQSTWLECTGDVEEDEIINRSDRRRSDGNREKIVEYFDANTCTTFKTNELVSHFTSTMPIKDRQVKYYLSDLATKNKISCPNRGHYKSINCVDDEEEQRE